MIERFNLQAGKNIFFHEKCKIDYVNSCNKKKIEVKDKSEWHFARDIRAKAYEAV